MRALERGMEIIEVVARSKRGLTLSQISNALSLPRSSVHCLLLTLERLGYLCRDDATHRYQCEMKLVRIANLALGGIVLRDKARPILRQLMEQTGLTVHMAISGGAEPIFVEKFSPLGTSRTSTWVGKQADFHCTSVGKCLLAFLPESQIGRIISERRLVRHNDKTIASASRLKAELIEVRRLGFAVDDEEEEIGFRCIGAPVFDAEGKVAAAISVSGTTEQIDLTRSSQLCAQVQEAARALSQTFRLSHVPSQHAYQSTGV